MNRRSFLQSILAAGVAPAIVRVESLMKIVVPTTAEVAEYSGFIGDEWIGFDVGMHDLSAEMVGYLRNGVGFIDRITFYDATGKRIGVYP